MEQSIVSDAQKQQINFQSLIRDGKIVITVNAKGETYVKQIDPALGIIFDQIQECLQFNKNFTIVRIRIRALKLTIEDLGLSLSFDNILIVQHQEEIQRLKQRENTLKQQNEAYHQNAQRLKAQIERLKQTEQKLKLQNESHTKMIVQLKQALEQKQKQLTMKFKLTEYRLHEEKLELQAKISEFAKENFRLQEILKSKLQEIEQLKFHFNNLILLPSQKDQTINQLTQNIYNLQAEIQGKNQSLNKMYHQFSKLRDSFNQKLYNQARQKSLMKKEIADKNLMLANFNLKSRESENRSMTPSKHLYQLALANDQIKDLKQVIQIKEGKIEAVTQINIHLEKQLNQSNTIVMELTTQLENYKKNQQNNEFSFGQIGHEGKINQVRSRSTSPSFETTKVINSSKKLEHKFGKLNPEVKYPDFKNGLTSPMDQKNKLTTKSKPRFDKSSDVSNKQKVSLKRAFEKENPWQKHDRNLSKGEKNELKRYLQTQIEDPNQRKRNQWR